MASYEDILSLVRREEGNHSTPIKLANTSFLVYHPLSIFNLRSFHNFRLGNEVVYLREFHSNFYRISKTRTRSFSCKEDLLKFLEMQGTIYCYDLNGILVNEQIPGNVKLEGRNFLAFVRKSFFLY